MLNKTPKANRLHIGIFGKRNAGKSSLLNALVNQEVAIVSEIAGTTTDPVEKTMEFLPLGPVVFIDTAGVDDEVGMFNTVDVYFEDDDETETYKIVTTVRGNSLKNLISKESPLGAAIFGHKVGDRCEVKVNDDYSYFVKIMKIQNTVDDGSDDLRKF